MRSSRSEAPPSCGGSFGGYNVYRKRHTGLFGSEPPIRLNSEPLLQPVMRVEYLPIAGPNADTHGGLLLEKIFDGPMGWAEIGTQEYNNFGDACPMTYAITSIDGSGQESLPSNGVLSYTDAADATGTASLNSCYESGPPILNTEMAVGITIPSSSAVILPGSVTSPAWTWRYGPDPNTDVGPVEGNWALVKWSLPTVDPNHGPANDFRLLRKKSGESSFSEMVLSSGERAHYNGPGSYGGPFVSATTSSPIGFDLAGNPWNSSGPVSYQMSISLDVGGPSQYGKQYFHVWP